ncbi:MAG: AAA family ATPase [Candidatus Micrarchaeota archaeon]|nr:AAA family ATPase [Candidatus Micrarchaeota archaeon]
MAPPLRSAGPEKSELVQEIIRKHHKTPIAVYKIKDMIMELSGNPHFMDMILLLLAFIAFVSAFPFYPIELLIIFGIVLIVASLKHPFLGLCLLMALMFPIIMYQTPPLAWVFMLLVSASLIFGYKYYRTIAFAYVLVGLGFSPLGSILEIPVFVIAPLIIGYKRGLVLTALMVAGIVMFSGVTGVQNSGYILYNAATAHAILSTSPISPLLTPHNPVVPASMLGSAISQSYAIFASGSVLGDITYEFNTLISALFINPGAYVAEFLGMLAIVVAIDFYAVTKRSKFKGTIASLIGAAFPLLYLGLATVSKAPYVTSFLPLLSFAIAPALMYLLELYGINIVKALEVRKQDVRLKFGEAFEDLEAGNATQTFDDIGNYEATKRELKEAVIAPIEEKGVARAYNIKPAKGILFFGPPGTGKTMMMRALANEIRASFYLVKAPNLISAFPGETERMISNIFAVAKKNSPCVLFIDEIDSVARNRESADVDEAHRHALSQLLQEIDGFQKINKVIIVGATNVPQLIDPAMMRPGRFDKIIYMPLPDLNGRKKIFKIYLNKLPASKDIDLDKIAEETERYSGADIKVVCDNVAQMVSQEATSQNRVLEITQEDILDIIKSTKPSTSFSQLEDYNKFRIDYERRSFEEGKVEKAPQISMDDVVGLEEAKKAIVEAIQIPLMHPELLKKYDIKPINGLLLFGPPGNGKSMLMRAVSNEMKGITILELRGSEFAGRDKESASETIKEVFNRARENIPSIIFIDEIDSIVPKRENATQSTLQMTGELLQEIDGVKQQSGIVVIAATNRPDSLDTAILRPGRFDKLIFVKPPAPEDRAKLFKIYLQQVPVSKDMDYAKLGTQAKGFTGADIANMCREAKTKALEENIKTGKDVEITMASMLAIINETKPSAPDTVISIYLSFLARYGQR